MNAPKHLIASFSFSVHHEPFGTPSDHLLFLFFFFIFLSLLISMDTSSQITIDAFNQLATAYQMKFMDLELYDDTYDAFCQLVPKPRDDGPIAIFEVGCGPGNITKYLLTQHPEFTVHAIDAAPNTWSNLQEKIIPLQISARWIAERLLQKYRPSSMRLCAVSARLTLTKRSIDS